MTQEEYDAAGVAWLNKLKSFSVRTKDAGEHSVAKLADLIIEGIELNKRLYDEQQGETSVSRE